MWHRSEGEGRDILFIHGWTMDHRDEMRTYEPVFALRSGWRRHYIDLPVDKVEMAWPATARANRQPAGRGGFRPRRERAGLLVADVHPVDAAQPPQAVVDRVQAVTGHAPDALDADSGQRPRHEVGDGQRFGPSKGFHDNVLAMAMPPLMDRIANRVLARTLAAASSE